MFAKFQFRFLTNAVMALGIMSGYSHQVMAQFSEHHHTTCDHHHDDYDGGSNEENSPDPADDCTCLLCGVSTAYTILAPIDFRSPTSSLSEISERLISQNPVPVVSGVYHPPQG